MEEPRQQVVAAASRYDAFIATFVGVLALLVSAYTAYIQRQQVRAQVLPIITFSSGNLPSIAYSMSNKGVGPATIRHVLWTVDDKPVRTWNELMERVLGPGKYGKRYSNISRRVLSPGEGSEVFEPYDESGAKLTTDHPGSLGSRWWNDDKRMHIEICYCSTLDDCWTLTLDDKADDVTRETRRCPLPSERSFRQ